MGDQIDKELRRGLASTAPAPNPARKAASLAAAMQAFDDASKVSAGGKGSSAGIRFMDVFNLLWSSAMKKRYLLASAAALVVAIPAAFTITGSQSFNLGSPVALSSSPELAATQHSLDPALNILTQDAQPAAKALAEAPRQQEGSATPLPLRAGERAAAAELAVIEALRLSTGQMSGLASEQLSAQYMPPHASRTASGGRFIAHAANATKNVTSEPVSTFSIDVDTASYAFARRSIQNGVRPDPDSVRVEEMVNYFPYDWQSPQSSEEPFRPSVTVVPTPWNPDTKLLHIGLRGYDVPAEQRPSNLVFLIDISGSMAAPDRLPLLKSAFRMLVEKLKPTDTVSIVTYAGQSGVALEATPASEKERILAAIDDLQPNGGTNGADGIRTAYRLAEESFVKDGVNRIFLATDGDFNVGASADGPLQDMVEEKRKSGVFLSVLGFGIGNYNDGLMQTLAQNGNGVAAYIDTLSEAQKVLSEEATASIFPIAKDVKIQVEFNPATVAQYRLIGYETRALATEDFDNDKVDAGEIGSGHRVTAIYEIVPKGSPADNSSELRYASPSEAATPMPETAGELAFLKIRYKKPDGDRSDIITRPVRFDEALDDIDAATQDVKFSIAVAAFGQKLKREPRLDDYAWGDVAALAREGRGEDRFGYRSEFLRMLEIVGSLTPRRDSDIPVSDTF